MCFPALSKESSLTTLRSSFHAGAAGYVHILVLERPVYVRERADGLYTPGTYLLYKLVEEGIIASIVSAVLSVAVYFGVAFQVRLALDAAMRYVEHGRKSPLDGTR